MKRILQVIGAVLGLGLVALAGFFFTVFNVETPAYQVVTQTGTFEIRDYPPLVVAQVTREGTRKTALRAGFRVLAKYIFATERTGERVAMTAPVTQQPIAMTVPVTQTQNAPDQWTVQFIMPTGSTRATLPPPGNAEVQLFDLPARRCATVRFNGRATDELLRAQELALREWMKAQGLVAAATPIYAYYNDPLTPGVFRRNEIIIDIVATSENQNDN